MKTEYVTDPQASYRKLSVKYGVSVAAINKRSQKEKWIEERQRHKDACFTKTVEKIAEKQADRLAKLHDVADDVLNMLRAKLAALDPQNPDVDALRKITSSLRDVKEIQMLKSVADMREQEARIAHLNRQASSDQTHEMIVTIDGGDDAWRN